MKSLDNLGLGRCFFTRDELLNRLLRQTYTEKESNKTFNQLLKNGKIVLLADSIFDKGKIVKINFYGFKQDNDKFEVLK